MPLKKLNIDESWTLFLDRDGVINKRIVDEYVLKWEQFEFLPGVFEAFKTFSLYFGKIIIVTNQQGIGKGLMTENDLSEIHSKMIREVEKYDGRIDALYYAPYIKESNHFDRKPNVGMGLKAKKEFPEINFKKSIMVGDSLSDMEFGHKLGMFNVFINENKNMPDIFSDMVNVVVSDLKEFSLQINSKVFNNI